MQWCDAVCQVADILNSRTSIRSLRIISGKYRGRKVTFPDLSSIRPTPNRVRETLFNWLTPHLSGARCFEPFAGSGVLCIEAISRGAGQVTIIDQSKQVIEHIRSQLIKIGVEKKQYHLHQGDALAYIRNQQARDLFDIVFLDPPFDQQLIGATCNLLSEQQLLAPDALIYIESNAEIVEHLLPVNWVIQRSKNAGNVHYCLCTVD